MIATVGLRSRSVNWQATFLACGPLTVNVGKIPGRSSPSLAVDFGASGFWARAAPAANWAAEAAIQWQRRIARLSENGVGTAASGAALLNRVKETGRCVKRTVGCSGIRENSERTTPGILTNSATGCHAAREH